MLIKTKKYKFPIKKYIKLGLLNTLKDFWWVWTLPATLFILSFLFLNIFWWLFTIALLLSILFPVFVLLQFYAISQHEQSKIIFKNLSYEIDSQKIVIKLNTKQGIPITWEKVKKGKITKDYILIFLNRAHLIYLPSTLFKNQNQIRFIETLFKKYQIKK